MSCTHGVAWLEDEFVSLVLYDDVYQDTQTKYDDYGRPLCADNGCENVVRGAIAGLMGNPRCYIHRRD
jgi:hypothetical protein